jgi:hypothetical protein
MNDVVYRIQQNRRSRLMLVHLDRLTPYQGTARALRRVQREQLESNYRENRAVGKEGEANDTSQAQPLGKKKWCYACRLFRTNNLKEGAV